MSSSAHTRLPRTPARSSLPGDRGISRRACLAASAAAWLCAGTAAAAPQVRCGLLHFGSVQWVADVIRRHSLDARHGFALASVLLANTDGGRIALMAGSADIIVSDWFFVASQRAAGTHLCFSPFSSASGGVMVPTASPVRSLSDLAGLRLGVAGGPLDKSWLLVQAAARSEGGADLAKTAQLTYGAPPLLNAALQRNQLDAVLTYWNFAARLDGAGFRQAFSVGECAQILGLSDRLSLIGFVFHEDWATQNIAAINGFLAAVAAAEAIMADNQAEWQSIRPMMDAADDVLFESLRRRFIEGIRQAPPEVQESDAARLFTIVRRAGGAQVTDGLDALPEGVFWPSHDG